MLNQLINRIRVDELGASMVEYALLVVLIAIAGFVAVVNFGDAVANTFDTIATSLTNAGN